MSDGPRPHFREGEMRSIVSVTLLDGTRWTKEVIAIKGKPLYCYHNMKRVFLEHVVDTEFKQVVYDLKPDVAEKPQQTWKFNKHGKAVKS